MCLRDCNHNLHGGYCQESGETFLQMSYEKKGFHVFSKMGSGYYQRNSEWRGSFSDQGSSVQGKTDRNLVSIIFKMKSNISEGNIFSSFESIFFEGKEIWGMIWGFNMTGIWKAEIFWLTEMRFLILGIIEIMCFGLHWCFVIVIQSINYGFDIIMEYLSNFGLTIWTGYKRMMGFFLVCIACFCFKLLHEFDRTYYIMTRLIKTFSKTLIGRCMNPPAQDMKALITNLPKIGGLENRVTGTDLGLGMFQFIFETEEEIEGMLALARWQSKKSPTLRRSPWVRVLGVPAEFRTAPTYESIGDAIGRTVLVDVEQARVQVVVDAFKELCFETTIDFKGGEFYAGRKLYLCHKTEKCPLILRTLRRSPRRTGAERCKWGWQEMGKHDERARSYKGVVINGNINQPKRERESRAYSGKGKGKVAEDYDYKWVKTAERGQKRNTSYQGNSRGHSSGDAGGSQRRSFRREDTAVVPQEVRRQALPSRVEGQTGQEKVREEIQEETREEGELQDVEEVALAPVSKEFQEALAWRLSGWFEGLQRIQSLVVSDRASERKEEDVMDMDEIQAALLEHGLDEQAIDALQAVSEEEIAEMMAGYEEEDQPHEEGEHANGMDEWNTPPWSAYKRGSQKRLFKPPINVAGVQSRGMQQRLDANKNGESKFSSSLNSGTLKI
ncbi:hypothetical protein Bca52824_027377 [Brassica carinata]|uniref:DUF4283 domain-containing protein n=1 Tax=Brassica carinata TaxID=52824 RepID=A0A8X7SLN8_BRACI|nr:hypothetical protein Bca52824_027377 [Brassica carinata]